MQFPNNAEYVLPSFILILGDYFSDYCLLTCAVL